MTVTVHPPAVRWYAGLDPARWELVVPDRVTRGSAPVAPGLLAGRPLAALTPGPKFPWVVTLVDVRDGRWYDHYCCAPNLEVFLALGAVPKELL